MLMSQTRTQSLLLFTLNTRGASMEGRKKKSPNPLARFAFPIFLCDCEVSNDLVRLGNFFNIEVNSLTEQEIIKLSECSDNPFFFRKTSSGSEGN